MRVGKRNERNNKGGRQKVFTSTEGPVLRAGGLDGGGGGWWFAKIIIIQIIPIKNNSTYILCIFSRYHTYLLLST